MYKFLILLVLPVLLSNCNTTESVSPVVEKRSEFSGHIRLRGQYKEELTFEAPVKISVLGVDTSFEITANNNKFSTPGLKTGKYKFISTREGFGAVTDEFEIKDDYSPNGNIDININIPKISTTKITDFTVTTEHILNGRLTFKFNGALISDNQEEELLSGNRSIRVFYSNKPDVSEANYLFTNITAVSYLGSDAVTFVPQEIQQKFHLQKGEKLYAVAVGDNNYFTKPFDTEQVNISCLSKHKTQVYEFEIK